MPSRLLISFLACLTLTNASTFPAFAEERAFAGSTPQPTHTPTLDLVLTQALQLRQKGASGLQEFLSLYKDTFPTDAMPPERLRQALDQLCQQRDCFASKLYWYTDFDQAKAAAQKENKPILSLRMLGELDQELSCANSRFFRVALYPNGAIAQELQKNYILHWESVRPVPTVTVDFGDGRKLQRTLTGNSIHYILAPTGEPIEALPGLYAPQIFLQELQSARRLNQDYLQQPAISRADFLAQYHRDRLTQLEQDWAKIWGQGGQPFPVLIAQTEPAPRADLAGLAAATKSLVETPLVRAALSSDRTAVIPDPATWDAMGDRYRSAAQLDPNSLELIRLKNAAAVHQQGFGSMVQSFEQTMAVDTARNEFLFHSQLHRWFAEETPQALTPLNERVYSQLFLTPSSDPWLGLSPETAFSGIENDGILPPATSENP
jgi:hypothetical protein